MAQMRLTRSLSDKMLLGVCSGIARRWGWDPTIIRVIFVAGTLLGFGTTILIYVILGVVMPRD